MGKGVHICDTNSVIIWFMTAAVVTRLRLVRNECVWWALVNGSSNGDNICCLKHQKLSFLESLATCVVLLSEHSLESYWHRIVASVAAVAGSLQAFAMQHIYSKKILGTSISWLSCFHSVQVMYKNTTKRKASAQLGTKKGWMPQLWHEEPLEASRIWHVLKTQSVFRGEHPHPSSNCPYVCAFPVCAVKSLCACRSSGRNWEPFSPKMCGPCPP